MAASSGIQLPEKFSFSRTEDWPKWPKWIFEVIRIIKFVQANGYLCATI